MTSQKKIREALLALLSTFPYDQINLSSVCQKADISRRTFSRYYSSLEDVVVDLIKDDFGKKADTLITVLPSQLIGASGKLVFFSIYESVYQRRAFYQAVVRGLGMPWLVTTIVKISLSTGDDFTPLDNVSDVEADYARHFFALASAGTIAWWIDRGFQPSPAEVARLIDDWAYGRLKVLQQKPRQEQESRASQA